MEISFEFDSKLVHIEITSDTRCLEIIVEVQIDGEHYEAEIIWVSFKINERNKKRIKELAIDKYIEQFGYEFESSYEGDYCQSRISSNEF